MNAPMRWAEFRRMPQDLQNEYVQSLVKVHGANVASMAKMFGVSNTTVRKLCPVIKELDFHSGRQNKDELERWNAFINPPEVVEEYVPEQAGIAEPISEPEAPDAESYCETCDGNTEPAPDTKPEKTTGMTQFSLVFKGPMDETMVSNSLHAMAMMIGGKSGRLYISFEADGEHTMF
jgi:hypothetical protein